MEAGPRVIGACGGLVVIDTGFGGAGVGVVPVPFCIGDVIGAVGFWTGAGAGLEPAAGFGAGGATFGGIAFPFNAASIRSVTFSIESMVEMILSAFKWEMPLLIPLNHFFFPWAGTVFVAGMVLGA